MGRRRLTGAALRRKNVGLEDIDADTLKDDEKLDGVAYTVDGKSDKEEKALTNLTPQPIETAPRDGSEVVLTFGLNQNGFAIACWIDGQWQYDNFDPADETPNGWMNTRVAD